MIHFALTITESANADMGLKFVPRYPFDFTRCKYLTNFLIFQMSVHQKLERRKSEDSYTQGTYLLLKY